MEELGSNDDDYEDENDYKTNKYIPKNVIENENSLQNQKYHQTANVSDTQVVFFSKIKVKGSYLFYFLGVRFVFERRSFKWRYKRKIVIFL